MMTKKCIYCSAAVSENSVVDMCQSCMYQVWGEKMAKAIVEGMERERSSGNLDLGQVSKNSSESSEAENLIQEMENGSDFIEVSREPVLEKCGFVKPLNVNEVAKTDAEIYKQIRETSDNYYTEDLSEISQEDNYSSINETPSAEELALDISL